MGRCVKKPPPPVSSPVENANRTHLSIMKFTALASLAATLPVAVSAAGTGNPFTYATSFLIPEYVDEVRAAVAGFVTFPLPITFH